ncbi:MULTISPECIES: major capsid protein [Clostridia]|uniref:major capsid protein n=1 Tax=Clostridia TaxID=186801 RepID=UPI00067F1D6A|nr:MULTISPECIES: major capsid protein [Clostridia]
MIKINDVYDSAAIAVYVKNEKSNAIPYLGTAFWPNERKASIDLKWIKTANGLPVSLAPSNFDAKATIRARKGFKFTKEEMAFFRESMVISEHDRIELAKLNDCTSPFVKDVVANIFNDTKNLVDGADVVPERMRMQLLFPETGGPSIYISSDGVTYQYNYDVDGNWAKNNRKTLTGPKLWANRKTAQPLEDIRQIVENAEEPIKYLVMSQAELNLFMACDSVKEALLAQNTTAHVMMTATVAKQLISNTFPGVEVIVYKKKFKDESGATKAFVPDGFIAFVPEGKLGNTWFGMTPEELSKMEAQDVDVTILPSGVAVVVMTTYDSTMQTTTVVSETLLPSYERMDSVYLLSTGTIDDGGPGELEELTVTSAEGAASGDTKITVSPELESGHSYKYKVGTDVSVPEYGAFVKNYTAWDGTTDITAVTGKKICVIECDSDYLAVKAGTATVSAKE